MPGFKGAARIVATAIFAIAIGIIPSASEAQRSRPRGDEPAAGRRSDGGGTGRVAVPREGSGGSTSAQPDHPARAPQGTSDRERTRRGDDSEARRVPPYSRPRDGQVAVGRAAPRTDPSRPPSGSTVRPTVRYYGGFYPWGYGGFGLSSYWGGYYEPWYYGSWYPYSYSYQTYQFSGYEGALRLKVKPVDAEVFVDGYYAGRVDDFDGIFQRLRIETGPHRIDIRLDGYEPLSFDVRILPDQKTTFEGVLSPSYP